MLTPGDRAPWFTANSTVDPLFQFQETTVVTRGRRFVYLPFLYDQEAAKVRAANARFVAGQDSAAADHGSTV